MHELRMYIRTGEWKISPEVKNEYVKGWRETEWTVGILQGGGGLLWLCVRYRRLIHWTYLGLPTRTQV